MPQFLLLVSNLTFMDFGIFGDTIFCNVDLKNGFFKSCFQQSAKGKMTALTVRSYHVFVKIFRL